MSLLKAIFRNKETPLSQTECLFQVSFNNPYHGSGWPSASVTVKREKGKQLMGVKTFPTGLRLQSLAKMPVVGMRTRKLKHRDALSENLSIANPSRLFHNSWLPYSFLLDAIVSNLILLTCYLFFYSCPHRSNKCTHSVPKVLYCRSFSREHIQMFEQPNC